MVAHRFSGRVVHIAVPLSAKLYIGMLYRETHAVLRAKDVSFRENIIQHVANSPPQNEQLAMLDASLVSRRRLRKKVSSIDVVGERGGKRKRVRAPTAARPKSPDKNVCNASEKG